MARCTGGCCRDIKLWTASGWRVSIDWLHVWVRRDQDVDAAQMLSVFRLQEQTEGGDVFRCAALGATGCTLAREQRPGVCTRFPNAGQRCTECGARSDAEARGVALMCTV